MATWLIPANEGKSPLFKPTNQYREVHISPVIYVSVQHSKICCSKRVIKKPFLFQVHRLKVLRKALRLLHTPPIPKYFTQVDFSGLKIKFGIVIYQYTRKRLLYGILLYLFNCVSSEYDLIIMFVFHIKDINDPRQTTLCKVLCERRYTWWLNKYSTINQNKIS